jgi:plasmid stability protein
MPTLTIRNIDVEVRNQIRIHAARHGRSMEAEVRDILNTYVRQQQKNPKQPIRITKAPSQNQ